MSRRFFGGGFRLPAPGVDVKQYFCGMQNSRCNNAPQNQEKNGDKNTTKPPKQKPVRQGGGQGPRR